MKFLKSVIVAALYVALTIAPVQPRAIHGGAGVPAAQSIGGVGGQSIIFVTYTPSGGGGTTPTPGISVFGITP